MGATRYVWQWNCVSGLFFPARVGLPICISCILTTFIWTAMHKAWPALLARMKANQVSTTKDKELVIASRTWFCLYLFEHQCVHRHLHQGLSHFFIVGCHMVLDAQRFSKMMKVYGNADSFYNIHWQLRTICG